MLESVFQNIENAELLFDLCNQSKLQFKKEEKQHLARIIYQHYLREYQTQLEKKDKKSYLTFCKMGKVFDDMQGLFSEYNQEIVQQQCYFISKNKQNLPNESSITVTMTSCKRFDLFERTVNSFLRCCMDRSLIYDWIVVDDNSNENDRDKMKNMFPFIHFIWKSEKQKGHVESMNLIVKSVKTPFLFHLEDDWEFLHEEMYLTRCLQVLQSNSQYGQCLVNKNYGEGNLSFVTIGGKYNVVNSNNHYFEHQHFSDQSVLSQEVQKHCEFMQEHHQPFTSVSTQYYWPHFSFRVGMTKMQVFQSIGSFEKCNHFEMQYAIRYNSKNYITTFLDSIYCAHIGRRTNERSDNSKTNAYELNNEHQFENSTTTDTNTPPQTTNTPPQVTSDSKIDIKNVQHALNQQIRTFVVNLKRRPNRLRQFYEDNKHVLSVLNVEVEEATDGLQIEFNQKVRKVFHTSDIQFQKGMMGCAYSHLKLWSKLMRDPNYQVYFVLEDDVKLSPHTIKILCTIPDKMNELFSDWDVLFLGHHPKKQREIEKHRFLIEKYNEEKFMEMSFGGTFCYLINKRGAEKLLFNLLLNGLNFAIDWDMSRLAGMNNYYTYPLVGTSEMANDQVGVASDIQQMSFRFKNDVNEWMLSDIQTMINILNQDGILYFERDSFNEFIYNSFKFSPNSNIIVSKNLVHKNLLFTHVCFTQISFDNCEAIQELLQTVIEQKLPLLFYLMYEIYLVTVPETLYNKCEQMKLHFSFNNKLDIEHIL